MFHLLPLAKGWEYKEHVLYRTVTRGAPPIEFAISETGWLLNINILSSDCHGTLRLDFQGADLQTRSGAFDAESLRTVGALAQDPSGWLQKYFRPDPNSTAGLYFSILFSGGYQGSTLPYIPTVKMAIYLPTTSTQESAVIVGSVTTIAITNKTLFIQSLRKILDANASLKIDPALLTVGPAEFKEGEEK